MTPVNANQVMVMCPEHGPQAVTGIVKGNVDRVEISGPGYWACPKCGRLVRLLEGSYTFVNNGTLANLRLTPQQLLRVTTALAWAQEASTKPDADHEVIERKVRKTLQKEAPVITSMVDKALGQRGQGFAAWLALIISIVGLFQGPNNQEITPELIGKIIEEVTNGDGTPSDVPTKQYPYMPIVPPAQGEPEPPLRT